MSWEKVASINELNDGDVKQVMYGDAQVCLARVGDEFLATTDVCSHEFVHLSGGWLEEDEIECPEHGSKFSMRTGEVLNYPATQPIAVYDVRLEEGNIYVKPREETTVE